MSTEKPRMPHEHVDVLVEVVREVGASARRRERDRAIRIVRGRAGSGITAETAESIVTALESDLYAD